MTTSRQGHEDATYLCTSCWTTFATEPDSKGNAEIRCPHCGFVQPRRPATLDPTGQRPHPAGATPESASSDAGHHEADFSPNAAAWRVKSESGLPYTFHGLAALRQWVGRHGAERAHFVSVDGGPWKLFADFLELLTQTGDAVLAYRGARSEQETGPDDDREFRPEALAPADPPDDPPGPGDAPLRAVGAEADAEAETAGGPAPSTVRPEMLRPPTFTFRVDRGASSPWPGRLVAFALGAAFGAGVVYVLLLTGVLGTF